MKVIPLYALLSLSIVLHVFGQRSILEKPYESPAKILKSTMNLLYYNRDYIKLYQDFVGYDPAFHILNKEAFFKLFASGNYLPLRLISNKKAPCYMLYKTNVSVSNEIHSILQGWGELDYKYYKMKGKRLPDFEFTDLDGNIYNKKTTKDKILVLKCWYLACQTCRQEIPALNELVDHYKNRKDILFVSLAFDSKDDIKKFLAKTTFKYAIVPDKKNYLLKSLNILQYPTHLIINKQGFISNVVNNSDDLTDALNIEVNN